MREYGVYMVTGRREYRGHKPGTRFVARLDRNAERRAINRRDIQLVDRIKPTVPPDFEFPDGWLPGQTTTTPQGRRKAPLSLGKE